MAGRVVKAVKTFQWKVRSMSMKHMSAARMTRRLDEMKVGKGLSLLL
jgi:hypothetical protein